MHAVLMGVSTTSSCNIYSGAECTAAALCAAAFSVKPAHQLKQQQCTSSQCCCIRGPGRLCARPTNTPVASPSTIALVASLNHGVHARAQPSQGCFVNGTLKHAHCLGHRHVHGDNSCSAVPDINRKRRSSRSAAAAAAACKVRSR